mmetsp:Transcript_15846/g.27028  ORF Transcript_15846/g.27028 Transcript_15846/m.27028 type:complete len:271 (+) Transcript_15846:69-881(+)
MASITSSPIRVPIAATSMEGAKCSSSKKRRPVDPDGSVAPTSNHYYAEQPSAKRARTIDDVLGSLSLRQPDPPGNTFCKRKNGDDGVVDGRSFKLARSGIASSASSSASLGNGSRKCGVKQDPDGMNVSSPSKVTSESMKQSTQQLCTSCAKQMCECNKKMDPPNSTQSNEMAIDDSDLESDSSVSESSIHNAMYQLVFGRRNPPPSINGNPCGRYDAVDSKIEDIIRRSRLEAVIKSKKQENKEEEYAMEMDTNGDMTDEDDEWNPGHG